MLPKAMPLTIIIFLLLTCLPCRLATNPNKLTEPHTSCLNPRNLFNTLVYFRIDSDPDLDFAIKTSYTAYYPKVLKIDLKLHGFEVLERSHGCGWQKSMSVNARTSGEVGRHRGDVYWKYRDPHAVQPKKQPHFIAATQVPIISRTPVQPRKATLNKIKRILQDNEPAADVYVLTTICLAYLSGFLALSCLLIVTIPRLLRRSRQPEDSDIELVAIKADTDADLVSALRRPTATVAVLPRTCEENARGHDTPPPQYSVFREDRCVRGSSGVARLKEAYGLVSRTGSHGDA
jgi:hypothetical protein